jgi:hypothetical protein
MNKSLSRALFLAGMVAVAGAGVAQAETFDSPTQAGEASTMTHGAPNQVTTNSPYGDNSTVIIHGTPGVVVDTRVMGAAPAVVGSTLPDTEVTYVYRPIRVDRDQAAATFNVPARAGEASTMTGGAPNMVTDNNYVIQHSRDPVVRY